ncbi:sulfite exporter TauE/SafE family protein [Spiroplasma culicicola]|uniref:Probable membrane transporter protein n=1 Tax=Spiroplasma culicicola AES-1 TaxID=1276246 RepID=W6A7J2_9MOLU|nr:sulfite exporter TauE/SafE family protein [Spiroplasma culicicola]AHI52951.1 hypothetical protein SCULI_v1c06100 [Spiroplasma culicicola AES-1]
MSIWIICSLFLLVILISSVGSISGVGGGVLYVPLLLVFFSSSILELEKIKFISTFLVLISSLFNVLIEIFKKRFSYIILLIGITFSVPTIFLGNWINSLLANDNYLKIIILVMLTIVTILLIVNEYYFSKNKLKQKDILEKNKWMYFQYNEFKLNWLFLSTIALLSGLITSLTGMGGGPILMPLLLMIFKLDVKNSTPISHTLIAISSFITLFFNFELFSDQTIMLNLVLPLSIAAIIGAISAIYLKRIIKKEIIIKWILIILIWASEIKMLIDIINS